jgi:hypothetical protein
MSQNYTAELVATARAISATGKGILAADESTGTIGKRFAGINVEVSFFTTTEYPIPNFSPHNHTSVQILDLPVMYNSFPISPREFNFQRG